jgi:hypothetical protein
MEAANATAIGDRCLDHKACCLGCVLARRGATGSCAASMVLPSAGKSFMLRCCVLNVFHGAQHCYRTCVALYMHLCRYPECSQHARIQHYVVKACQGMHLNIHSNAMVLYG